MCSICNYPAQLAGLMCKIISLLILTVLVYAIGGCVGTYEVLFSGIDSSSNKTTNMEKAVHIIQNAYKLGELPTAFHTWGLVFSLVYVAAVLVLGVILCARLTHSIGQDLDEVGRSAQLEDRQRLRKQYEEESSSAL